MFYHKVFILMPVQIQDIPVYKYKNTEIRMFLYRQKNTRDVNHSPVTLQLQYFSREKTLNIKYSTSQLSRIYILKYPLIALNFSCGNPSYDSTQEKSSSQIPIRYRYIETFFSSPQYFKSRVENDYLIFLALKKVKRQQT